MAEPFGHFTHALVRALPPPGDPREEALGVAEPPGPAPDPAKARRQWGVLGGVLRQRLGLQLLELPPAPGGLRPLLLEELVVVQGGTALLTRPGPPRHQELGGLREVLEQLQLRVLSVTDEGAALDGGDVLFTGREFFVGISPWTNLRGAEAVADAFRDFTVSTVPVGGGGRLKGFCSMAAPQTIAHGSSDCARRAIKAMEQLSDHAYSRLPLPDDAAGNCLFTRPGGLQGGVLLHRGPEEFPPRGARGAWPGGVTQGVVIVAFQKVPGVSLVPLDLSEAAKVGGALSSCCVLLWARPGGRGQL
ncbi:PREDICTED: N(G),N(G)-dimethylarginine dimethylaminohydrolase 2-like [Pseudopodoces humilis]|uniref:N(G),N(G)-dimethylarginine dimethylaminohydrolase 2-like n=1 Tax=Pseudopodoces humilis TaxID=181119 RepID=UPI0006B6B71E|nr:PREDICTED: N(G),N(G)-dimethylarginine dimethylaminohydrolase 2-like [Pseudopodoces humilis]